ncbi:dolichyl-phosphate beta-D-mannosyltransferase [Sporocytophaga myxococcoides]|uniref:Dolichyl-phosphate beta-D-mannosyltransferase n=1 Tax=Sporocytophaga myxococcoides TaxID=153721 RepID=A0A098LJN5_9BACT|nr:polyprenol monophosphomannose synthase [Sporocytophaga myxococcoides]GAL86268.1 dolichyl-phosphate beta-D-mannosyltransferase [Sporocytophaga myxococcoides]
MEKAIVIIPTYNEKENIETVIRKVFTLSIPFDVLIIDDGSPDGTADIVKELQLEYPGRLFLEQRKGKLGLGTAYIHGFRYAIARNYEYICEMDADMSHNPEDLVKLYNSCAEQGYDLAIGSRYVNGITVINWPMSRVLMSYYASTYVRFITGMRIQDTTAGFKCYRKKVLETINLDDIKFTGYAFQIKMKFLTWKYGFKIIEVPIIFTDRTLGQSKMSSGIFKEAVFGVLQMKIESLFKQYIPEE